MTAAAGRELHRNHVSLICNLDRLRLIVNALDNAQRQPLNFSTASPDAEIYAGFFA